MMARRAAPKLSTSAGSRNHALDDEGLSRRKSPQETPVAGHGVGHRFLIEVFCDGPDA
jgi:hypothetical protein